MESDNKINSLEELKAALAGPDDYVTNDIWWFHKVNDNLILGGCDDPNCCDWQFETVEDMYNYFKKDLWKKSI